MKKLLITVAAYIAILFAPTAAKSATIVEPYTIPLPVAAGLPPLVLATTNIQQFDPALGTLNDVEVTLTGPFQWIPNQPGNSLSLTLTFGPSSTHITSPNFPAGGGFEMANLMGTLTAQSALLVFTGTSSITGDLDFNWSGGPIASPDVIARAGAAALTGTVTYDYTAAVSGVPELSTWTMMLLGFVGLGFAFRQSRRKVAMA